MVCLGLLCAYLTLCGFFYASQWQFVLHPSRTLGQTPATVGLPFTPIRFDDDPTGQPQLSGWWIPGDSSNALTALVLHSERGSMSDALPLSQALHEAHLNVLLFDYRGYGQSAGPHPDQRSMEQDASGALKFLNDTKHVPASRVVPAGVGLGASLAVRLCRQQQQIPALILVDADGDTLSRVERDQRSRIVPIGLLFHERFPLADQLATLTIPKLLISYTRGDAPLVAQRAADPKTTAELPSNAAPAMTAAAIQRFLDTYSPQPGPATLLPH